MSDATATQYARSADGTRIAYQVIGNGPLDLVFMAGMAVPVDLIWDSPGAVRIRNRLAGFSRTIWYDGRGLGSSDGDPLDAESFDADLIAVLDAVGSPSVALMSAGMNGPNLIRFAARHPDRVGALILYNTYAHYVRHVDYPWGVPAGSMDRFMSDVQDKWGTDETADTLAPSHRDDDRFLQWWTRNQRLGVAPHLLAALTRANFEDDARPLLSSIHVPTLVVHREGNRYIQVGAARYMAEHIDGAKFVALPGDDHLFLAGDSDGAVDEIEEFLTGSHQAAEGDVLLATILFTDIVDSTSQVARLGPRAWSKLTYDHDALVRAALQRHRGREIKTTGDGFLATFNGGAHAVRCATEIVVSAKAIGLDVRAGLHTGEIEFRGDDIAGLAVTIAKRVCDIAGPTQVLVSETSKGLLVGSGITLSDHGSHILKGVPDEWRLFIAAD